MGVLVKALCGGFAGVELGDTGAFDGGVTGDFVVMQRIDSDERTCAGLMTRWETCWSDVFMRTAYIVKIVKI